MNHIVIAGIVSSWAATDTDRPCCRGTIVVEPLQEGQPDAVLQLVAWGKQLDGHNPTSIIEGRLAITRAENGASVSTIEVARLHPLSDGAPDLNSVSLVGRAGRDPEIRYFESGSVVANLTLAVNRGKDRDPDWFNLEIWGKQAQVAADYVRKGSLLGITGSFKLDHWTDRATGKQRSKPVIRVDRLELLGSKRDGEQGAQQPPAPAAAPARRSRPTPAAPVWDGGSGADADDIPF